MPRAGVPQFSATLMPGLVRNHERAQRLNNSPFMEDIKKIIDDNGAIVLSDAWLAGGFASKKKCITSPESVKGQMTRAAGPAFEQMLVGAGASISSMPSSEIYTAMQTGVLDAANTSSGSFVSYRIYEQVKCLTAPGENALWFMYEPILMSKRTFDKLDKEQQEALLAAGKKAEDYFAGEAKKLDDKMIAKLQEGRRRGGRDVAGGLRRLARHRQGDRLQELRRQGRDGQKLIDEALAVQ